jgi:hypothetical protein
MAFMTSRAITTSHTENRRHVESALRPSKRRWPLSNAEIDLLLVYVICDFVAHEQHHGDHARVEGEHGLDYCLVMVDADRGHDNIVKVHADTDEWLHEDHDAMRNALPERKEVRWQRTGSTNAAMLPYLRAYPIAKWKSTSAATAKSKRKAETRAQRQRPRRRYFCHGRHPHCHLRC